MSEPDPAPVAAAGQARPVERLYRPFWRARTSMMLLFGILGPCIAFGVAMSWGMVRREHVVLFIGPAIIVVLSNVALGLNRARRGGSPFFLGICSFTCVTAGCYAVVLFPAALFTLAAFLPLGLLGLLPIPAFWNAGLHAIAEVEKIEWRRRLPRTLILLALGAGLPIALPCALHAWAVHDAGRLIEAWEGEDARAIERAQADLRRSGWVLGIPEERIEDPVTPSVWPSPLGAPLRQRLENARARHPVTVALFGLDMDDLMFETID